MPCVHQVCVNIHVCLTTRQVPTCSFSLFPYSLRERIGWIRSDRRSVRWEFLGRETFPGRIRQGRLLQAIQYHTIPSILVCLSPANYSLANSKRLLSTYRDWRSIKIIFYLTCLDRSGVIFQPSPIPVPSYHTSGTDICGDRPNHSLIAPFFGRCGCSSAILIDF